MTLNELLDIVNSIEGVSTKFKRIAGKRILIFWKEHSPIASVFIEENSYRKDYPKFFEMYLEEIFIIDQALYDFTQTPVEDR